MSPQDRKTLLSIAAIQLTDEPDQTFTEIELFSEAQNLSGISDSLDFKSVLVDCNFLEIVEENKLRLK